MPSILVVYYSQTGQLLKLAKSMLSNIPADIKVDYEQIVPIKPFPYPWQSDTFFDTMPECFLQLPVPLQKPNYLDKNYDLVILAWQPWFVTPSLPMSSWLQSSDVQSFLKDKPVITLCGCRNMWVQAHQKIKQHLKNAQAKLVGHIVCEDRAPNLVSVLTIMRWMFEGQQEASKWLPAAGVNQEDVAALANAGTTMLPHLQSNNWDGFQQKLIDQKFIDIKPHLLILEERAVKGFTKFAAFIRQKGGAGDVARKGRVNVFKWFLIVSIFILSPLSSLVATIISLIRYRYVQNEIAYFKGIESR